MAIQKVDLGAFEAEGGKSVGIVLAQSTLAGRFTQAELERAFRVVQNRDHWKGPICAIVPASMREVVAAAIEHFAGCEAEFTACANGTQVEVRAVGYWAAIGA